MSVRLVDSVVLRDDFLTFLFACLDYRVVFSFSTLSSLTILVWRLRDGYKVAVLL